MSTETIRFAKTNAELIGLKPILDKWTALVEHYSNIAKGDACYWYNERASISTLAGAAWCHKNWIALEEYSTLKRHSECDELTGKVKERNGRCDLYLASPNACAQYAIEAKQAWQPIGDRVNDPYARLIRRYDKAFDDAGSLHKNEATHRLAATFCVPSISIQTLTKQERDGDSLDDIIAKWCKGLMNHKKIRYDAIAYCFPKNTRHLSYEEGKRIYPGVALFLKERNKARKTLK